MPKRLRVRRKASVVLNKRREDYIRNKGGQPAKFNFETKRIIYEAIAAGMKPIRAAELAGVKPSQYNEWMKRGRIRHIDYSRKYRRFRLACKKIERQREKEAIDIVRLVAKGGVKTTETKIRVTPQGKTIETITRELAPKWQPAAWFLERTIKDIYGPQAPTDERSPEDTARQINQLVQAMNGTVPPKAE